MDEKIRTIGPEKWQGKIEEKPVVIKTRSNEMKQTSLMGFCCACGNAHIKEHVHRDKVDKHLYCNRVGAPIITDGFHPPIRIQASEEEINDPDYTFQTVIEDAQVERLDPDAMRTMLPEMFEDLLVAVGIDPKRHGKDIQTMTKTLQSWILSHNQPKQKALFEDNIDG